jgi:hypothetical protein
MTLGKQAVHQRPHHTLRSWGAWNLVGMWVTCGMEHGESRQRDLDTLGVQQRFVV